LDNETIDGGANQDFASQSWHFDGKRKAKEAQQERDLLQYDLGINV
jgi:hypothetical protein